MALDREHRSQHTLKVMVTDQGHPRLNATATVHILVTDTNDNPPRFTHLPASKELNVQVILVDPSSVHVSDPAHPGYRHGRYGRKCRRDRW